MKTEREIIEELRRAKIAQRKLDGDGSDKATLRGYQSALLWAIDEIDTTEVDVVESLLQLRDRESAPDKSSNQTNQT